MFLSTYLPVNIKRKNAAIHTDQMVYPADLLRLAEGALTTGENMSSQVILENNVLTFIEHPEYKWPIPDVYLACEALRVAEENNFSFYTVANKEGVPQLFISKAFKQCRLLVNAMTFKTVLVTKPNLVRRISVMIDMRYESTYCMNVFEVVSALEAGSSKYLDAIIVERDTEDEAMIVNPITTLYSDDFTIYDKDVLSEYRRLLAGEAFDSEYVEIVDDMFCRKNVKGFAPVTRVHAKAMVELYDKLLAKKCNYINLVGDDFDTHYYVSTNWRYLVNASTFECVVVTNTNLKKLMQGYVMNGTTPTSDLTMCWLTARTEPK